MHAPAPVTVCAVSFAAAAARLVLNQLKADTWCCSFCREPPNIFICKSNPDTASLHVGPSCQQVVKQIKWFVRSSNRPHDRRLKADHYSHQTRLHIVFSTSTLNYFIREY
jgi:hypothetical protein